MGKSNLERKSRTTRAFNWLFTEMLSGFPSMSRFVLLAWLAFATCVGAAEAFLFRGGERILFLGDSNTYADGYIIYLDAFLFTRFPTQEFELINRGMPSETVAGTSEASHIPPRPDLHTRYTRTAPPLTPDWIIACYGMNDGIYQPPNQEIFENFKSGIRRLISRTEEETQARLILLTPPPFDSTPFNNKPDLDLPDYRRPASNYDQTLAQFSSWLLQLANDDLQVIDLHTPVNELVSARRQTDPGFKLAGDGIHINQTGHIFLALQILEALHAPSTIATATINVLQTKTGQGTVRNLKQSAPGKWSADWLLPLPLPRDRNWDPASLELARFQPRINRLELTLAEMPAGNYKITLGNQPSGSYSAEALSAGVDLGESYEKAAFASSQEILRLVQERRQLLLEHWVKHDPHPRLAGMHKDSTASEGRINDLAKHIRNLAVPSRYPLSIQRVEE